MRTVPAITQVPWDRYLFLLRFVLFYFMMFIFFSLYFIYISFLLIIVLVFHIQHQFTWASLYIEWMAYLLACMSPSSLPPHHQSHYFNQLNLIAKNSFTNKEIGMS